MFQHGFRNDPKHKPLLVVADSAKKVFALSNPAAINLL